MFLDPHEKQQNALMKRISNSIERLADVLDEVNVELEKAEEHHPDIDQAYHIWTSYSNKLALETVK